jgi:hypothetical protein
MARTVRRNRLLSIVLGLDLDLSIMGNERSLSLILFENYGASSLAGVAAASRERPSDIA